MNQKAGFWLCAMGYYRSLLFVLIKLFNTHLITKDMLRTDTYYCFIKRDWGNQWMQPCKTFKNACNKNVVHKKSLNVLYLLLPCHYITVTESIAHTQCIKWDTSCTISSSKLRHSKAKLPYTEPPIFSTTYINLFLQTERYVFQVYYGLITVHVSNAHSPWGSSLLLRYFYTCICLLVNYSELKFCITQKYILSWAPYLNTTRKKYSINSIVYTL